jgi:predicted DNA-binding protein
MGAMMVTKEKGKQAQITSYYDPGAVQRLKDLSATTRVPQAAYLREALADLLKKYAAKVPKAPGKS